MISRCTNGITNERFGLCEPFNDYKIIVKIYDGIYARNNPQTWWKGRLREADVAVDAKHEFVKVLNHGFELLLKDFKSRGGTYLDATIPANSVGDAIGFTYNNNNNIGVLGKRRML